MLLPLDSDVSPYTTSPTTTFIELRLTYPNPHHNTDIKTYTASASRLTKPKKGIRQEKQHPGTPQRTSRRSQAVITSWHTLSLTYNHSDHASHQFYLCTVNHDRRHVGLPGPGWSACVRCLPGRLFRCGRFMLQCCWLHLWHRTCCCCAASNFSMQWCSSCLFRRVCGSCTGSDAMKALSIARRRTRVGGTLL